MLQRRSYKNRAEYLDAIPPFGFIINMRSAALRFLQHSRLLCFTRPHTFLLPDQVPPSRHELLRKLLGFAGLHFKLLRRLFLSEHGWASSQFTFFVLNRVASKLALETPEAEAASLVTWMKDIRDEERAVDEDYWDRGFCSHLTLPRGPNRRNLDFLLGDSMSELSTSANGRYRPPSSNTIPHLRIENCSCAGMPWLLLVLARLLLRSC